jgi:LAO/AO transport system kinase
MVPKKKPDIQQMVQKLLTGDRRSAARLITLVENEVDEHHDIMRLVYPHTGHALIIGITGAGGAGKSSLTDHLIGKFREKDKKVGAVVVDPSSPFSGGAFLGDRIRLQNHSQDEGVYIRSLASRGNLGGLSRATYDVIRILEAMGMEVIFVETLGAGQDEIDIVQIASTCLLVLTPGMGDDIQAMKAGIMEIADIIVLNKADLDGATTCLRHLEAVLSVAQESQTSWKPRIVPTVSVASKAENLRGIDELVQTIGEHQNYLRSSREIDQAKFVRIEHELGLIFKDELQKIIFKGLRGTGKKKKYIRSIMDRKNDPYSVVDEVLNTYLFSGK